jgi:hypothetical protein
MSQVAKTRIFLVVVGDVMGGDSVPPSGLKSKKKLFLNL